jgi:hypothetical protein
VQVLCTESNFKIVYGARDEHRGYENGDTTTSKTMVNRGVLADEAVVGFNETFFCSYMIFYLRVNTTKFR